MIKPIPSRLVRWMVCGAVTLGAFGLTQAQAQDQAQEKPAAQAVDPALAKEFETLLAQVRQGGNDEKPVLRLVELARQLGKPYTAEQALKAYLTRNLGPTATLLHAAARNATLAGEYRTAVARYKSIVNNGPDNAQSSEAAGELYALLVDVLQNGGDAYQIMKQADAKLRKHVRARQFEPWFLDVARKRDDYQAAARRLALIMGDKLPLEQERIFYWHDIDWLFGQLEHADDGKRQAAAEDARTIAAAIRDDKARQTRFAFIAEHLAWVANLESKEDAQGAQAFKPVLDAARKAIAADTRPGTLKLVIQVLAGGHRLDLDRYNRQRDAIQGFFVESFGKLDDAGRMAMLRWEHHNQNMARHMASPEQWRELVGKHPGAFKDAFVNANIPIDLRAEDVSAYKQLAPVLKESPSFEAALATALASGDSLAAAGDHLIKQHGWHLNFDQAGDGLQEHLWPAWRALHEDAEGDVFQTAIIRHLRQHLAGSALGIFSHESVRPALTHAWRQAVADDQQEAIIADLEALAWLPWNQDQRNHAIGQAYDEFKEWTKQVRDQEDAPAETVAKISKVEAAFKNALDPDSFDLSKAPDDLSRNLAQCVMAIRGENLENYNAAANAAYQQVRNYRKDRTPLALAVITWLVHNRETFDTIELQASILEDQIKLWDGSEGGVGLVGRVASQIMSGRRHWGWGNIHKNLRDRARRINQAIENGLVAQLKDGNFDGRLFNWILATKNGRGYLEQGWNQDLMDQVVQTKALLDDEHFRQHRSGTATYQWLIHHRFQTLRDKYSPHTYFDDMFVEEAKKTGQWDDGYWRYGHDRNKTVADAAASMLASLDQPPLGYGNQPDAMSRGEYNQWQNRVIRASPEVRNQLLEAWESSFGKTRFDDYAMGRGYFFTQADIESNRDEYFARLKTYAQRSAESPSRPTAPQLDQLEKIELDKLTPAEADVLVLLATRATPSQWHGGNGYERAAMMLHESLTRQGRFAELYALAPQLWRIARDANNADLQRQLVDRSRELLEAGQTELAAVYTNTGSELLGSSLPEDVRSSLLNVRAKALLQSGGTIPVPRSDPRYPLYEAQLSYLSGKLDTAWEQYEQHADRVPGMLKELDPQFLIWMVQKHTELDQFDAAEALARRLITWVDQTPRSFDPETRAGLALAYADIAFARQEYPRARAGYERIVASDEFNNTQGQRMAEIKIAGIFRLTGQYDLAIERLQKLLQRDDRFLQMEAHYQMARVLFDQEAYLEASEHLTQTFAFNPSHASARLLEGEVNLKLKKLGEVTELKLGLSDDQRYIVPGRELKVDLQDRSLQVVGRASDVQIRVWTESGDEEFFNLFPAGDSKTEFEGSIMTSLAAVQKGDHQLQVLGGDKVYFDFSENFARQQKVRGSEPQMLQVVTDPELYVSSGRILTKAELEERALESRIRNQLRQEMGDNYQSRLELDIVRRSDQIKPGNPINVRVIDPDASVTAEKDTLTVRVSTTSGDSIEAFELVETDSHSGVFEGAVPTASGQAIAYASDSDEGKQANFAISAGDYPAWVGLPDNRRPKIFSVDLNDNVAVGRLSVLADVAGRKLKDFVVQTSLNGRDFTTVAQWPKAFEPWDGRPRRELVRLRGGQLRDAGQIQRYLSNGYIEHGDEKIISPVKEMAGDFNRNVDGQAGQLNVGWNDWFVARYRAAFFQPDRRMRTFKINDKNQRGDSRYFLAIDGQVGSNPTEFSGSLGAGVHRVDVYVVSQRHAQPNFALHCDIPEPPYMGPCPASMFDPEQNPQVRDAIYTEPARVTAEQDNGLFHVDFSLNTRARIVRLLLRDFETDAPAIREISLTDMRGGQVLPTQVDFMSLQQNDQLEIVPGDRISVTYEDPSTISAGEQVQEGFLNAIFADAEISAAFVEYTQSDGEQVPTYIPMRRFKIGDKINVFIKDPDMDETEERDTVVFTAQASSGKPARLRALETSAHSGVFLGSVWPVQENPERDGQILVGETDDIVLNYQDQENTDPGIPWTRTYLVEQPSGYEPRMHVYDVRSEPLSPEQRQAQAAQQESLRRFDEMVPITHVMVAERPERSESAQASTVMVDGPLIVDLIHPAIALSPQSTATIYVQTATGREKYGQELSGEQFDLNVPGTIRLARTPSGITNVEPPAGYSDLVIRGEGGGIEPLDQGRFAFTVPMELGAVPEHTLAFDEETPQREREPLMIQGNDVIYIGYSFKTPGEEDRWLVKKVTLDSDARFHVMDRRYHELVTGVHVGESAYLRVIQPTLDTSDEKDTVTVQVKAQSGATDEVELTETFGHSGVFKGIVNLVYKGEPDASEQTGALPVDYGDKLTLTYNPGQEETLQAQVEVYKGADGSVLPFTKRFKDPSIAVQTQFTIAEAYFEQAKRHRELGDKQLARRQIAQGKKLLEEAIRDYPDADARAQADYLLAELAFEYGRDAQNEQVKKQQFIEAITRFSDIVSSYPDSSYAPRAQYKKALVLESMSAFEPGAMDRACEEYVKLSYRYPDNPLVAETIARLGNYFLNKGKGMIEEAQAESDLVEREKIKLQAKEMYTTAAEVFGRLGARFPDHTLAGKTQVISGQCYVEAGDYQKAVSVFKNLYERQNPDKELAPVAMYWAGDSYYKLGSMENAYRTFKKLTWDYPESMWAKYARGRLTEERMVSIGEREASGQ